MSNGTVLWGIFIFRTPSISQLNHVSVSRSLPVSCTMFACQNAHIWITVQSVRMYPCHFVCTLCPCVLRNHLTVPVNNLNQTTNRYVATSQDNLLSFVCYVVSCRVVSCRVMSCHVMSCHAMLCYVMLCYVMLCYVMLCYVMLCYVMLCYVMLCYVMLCYVMLCYVMLCYVMLCYVMLCYVMLCYVMLCYVMLCYVMLCYVMLCYVMLCYVMLCYVMLCYVMLCYVMCHSCFQQFSRPHLGVFKMDKKLSNSPCMVLASSHHNCHQSNVTTDVYWIVSLCQIQNFCVSNKSKLNGTTWYIYGQLQINICIYEIYILY